MEEEEDNIQCDKCSHTFHSICTGLDKRQYERLMNNDKEEYVCHLCSESGGSVKTELSIIKTKLNIVNDKINKLDQLDALQTSMTFMSQQFDEIIKGIAENKKQLETVKKENKVLKSEIKDLKDTVTFLNNNRVKNDCLISGVVVNDSDTAMDTLINTFNKVGVNVKPEELDDAFFIGKKKTENKQTVVAKFKSKLSKQKIMSAKPKLNENEETKTVFVNDFLTKETLSLLNYAKALKAVGYRRVYAKESKVFVKKSELSKPKRISSTSEVDELLLQATTNRVHSRRSQHQARNDERSADESDVDPNSFVSPT